MVPKLSKNANFYKIVQIIATVSNIQKLPKITKKSQKYHRVSIAVKFIKSAKGSQILTKRPVCTKNI